MNKYAIFMDDSEIHIDLEIGTIESLEAIREVIAEEIKANPLNEHGVIEQYPFCYIKSRLFCHKASKIRMKKTGRKKKDIGPL